MYASFSDLIRSFPLRPYMLAEELGVSQAVMWSWTAKDLVPSWQFSNFVRVAERIQHPGVTYKVMCDLAEQSRISRGYTVGKQAGNDAHHGPVTPPMERETS